VWDVEVDDLELEMGWVGISRMWRVVGIIATPVANSATPGDTSSAGVALATPPALGFPLPK
jgi:hypothetical protein